ncbi:MAG: hypothetical protein JL55_14515 [Pseudomonas sp. BICA1-14]|nr:MAG: hypothetical protein JL55_14515 [[Pseudomonas] sp. BICA1-14]
MSITEDDERFERVLSESFVKLALDGTDELTPMSDMRSRFAEAGRLWGRSIAVCLYDRPSPFAVRALEAEGERRFLKSLNNMLGLDGALRR